MSFAQNLTRFMERADIDQSELARRLDISSQAVNQWCNGETRPNPKKFPAIAAALGIKAADLFRNFDEIEDVPIKKMVNDLSVKTVLIPEIAVKPQAGPGASEPQRDATGGYPIDAEWQIPAEYLGHHLNNINYLRVITVDGDSMEPEYRHGEKVLVDLSHTTPNPPGVYVLWDGYGLVMKSVEILIGRREPTIRLHSLNSNYPDYECPLEEAKISGKIVAKWMWK